MFLCFRLSVSTLRAKPFDLQTPNSIQGLTLSKSRQSSMVTATGQCHQVKNVIFQVFLIWVTSYRTLTYDVMPCMSCDSMDDVITPHAVIEWWQWMTPVGWKDNTKCGRCVNARAFSFWGWRELGNLCIYMICMIQNMCHCLVIQYLTCNTHVFRRLSKLIKCMQKYYLSLYILSRASEAGSPLNLSPERRQGTPLDPLAR